MITKTHITESAESLSIRAFFHSCMTLQPPPPPLPLPPSYGEYEFNVPFDENRSHDCISVRYASRKELMVER